ncbi:MAG: phosphoribosylformylglycinamidine synthase subunit PurS, partial [Ilumatobacter sp.]
MSVWHRMTIRSIDPDPRVRRIRDGAAALGLPPVGDVEVADLVHVRGDLTDEDRQKLHGLLVDPLLQKGTWSVPTGRAVEIAFLPGVTDTAGDAVETAAAMLGLGVDSASTGLRVEFREDLDDTLVHALVERLLMNPIIERSSMGTIEPLAAEDHDPSVTARVIEVRGLDDEGLAAVGASRSLYLDPEELRAIRDHFESIGRDPTDVEIETLAQTWSEHCAHKTFRAVIDATEPGGSSSTRREPLMKQLRSCTEEIDAPFVRSAFVGNAGVIEFVAGTTLALKAETHNHPSAVEPFGGANTGVGGVIRDVLGIAHKPIAITDILCFGPTDLPLDDLPDGSLHPRRVQEGVIDGVADYGNKIGLPTVAGAILYDPAYTTNPLVFAGCIGAAPTRALHDGPHAGDRVIL